MVVAVDAVVIKCSLKATIADVTKMTTETSDSGSHAMNMIFALHNVLCK